MMETIDKRQVQRAFSRAATNGNPGGNQQPGEVVAERLLSYLDEITLVPKVMADIGGGGCPILAKKYHKAKMLAVDFALPVLRASGNSNGNPAVWRVQADAENLPLADGSLDLAYSNLCLEWTTDAGAAIAEAARVLRAGGLFLFSTLGPDTLCEMRAAFGGRVHRFADMHDIGDMLPPRGFAEPVMQREEIRLTYARPEDAAREMHKWGAGFASTQRQRGMTGKQRWQKCLSTYPRSEDGGCAATFEIIYALAWRAEGGGKGKNDEKNDGTKPMRFFSRL